MIEDFFPQKYVAVLDGGHDVADTHTQSPDDKTGERSFSLEGHFRYGLRSRKGRADGCQADLPDNIDKSAPDADHYSAQDSGRFRESLFSPLKIIKVPVHEMSMMMSIALRFIPTLIEETDKIMKAQVSRGADYDTGTFINRVKGYITVLIPLFVSSFRRAEELAVAMDARCYKGGAGRTKLNPLKIRSIDVIVGLFLTVCAAGLVVMDLTLR